jgi:hypothetical protein
MGESDLKRLAVHGGLAVQGVEFEAEDAKSV